MHTYENMVYRIHGISYIVLNAVLFDVKSFRSNSAILQSSMLLWVKRGRQTSSLNVRRGNAINLCARTQAACTVPDNQCNSQPIQMFTSLTCRMSIHLLQRPVDRHVANRFSVIYGSNKLIVCNQAHKSIKLEQLH